MQQSVTNNDTAAHWLLLLQVARRLGLEPLQMLRMRLALKLHKRMARDAAAEGKSVVQGMASLSISRVLEEVNGHSSSSSAGSSLVSDEAAAAAVRMAADAAAAPADPAGSPAAAAAVTAHDGAAQIAAINSKLQRHMRLRSIQSGACAFYMQDQLSRLQLAEVLAGEFVVAPSLLC
jgi:hypothetical protein